MKIILEAFGKLRSEAMDVPESTGLEWKMVLKQPLVVKSAWDGEKSTLSTGFNTVGQFSYTGRSYMLGENEFAKIYELTDIYKA